MMRLNVGCLNRRHTSPDTEGRRSNNSRRWRCWLGLSLTVGPTATTRRLVSIAVRGLCDRRQGRQQRRRTRKLGRFIDRGVVGAKPFAILPGRIAKRRMLESAAAVGLAFGIVFVESEQACVVFRIGIFHQVVIVVVVGRTNRGGTRRAMRRTASMCARLGGAAVGCRCRRRQNHWRRRHGRHGEASHCKTIEIKKKEY